jgi:hypothetical protein
MSERIHQLEEALTYIQSSISAEAHPLLRSDLLRIKSTAELHGARMIDSNFVSSSATDEHLENDASNPSQLSFNHSLSEEPNYDQVPPMHVSHIILKLSFLRLSACDPLDLTSLSIVQTDVACWVLGRCNLRK